MKPTAPLEYTADWLRRCFASGRAGDSPVEDGIPAGPLRPAAVLVPIVLRAPEPSVLLTRRTDHLHHHPGQVSFPGGRVETQDASPLDTALRETEEEIGLHRNQVELLGCLPEYRTGTGFEITPVVGLVSPPFKLKLDTFEVAEAFEVPLSFLLDTANHQRHAAVIRGKRREYYAMPYGDYFIWGATAGMIVSLHRFVSQ
ncbi:CoA pyrophosphatase [Zoogloea sp.]|uniref:CoA pyrophosphatase n=1 Tax=Zoogloea sp. TaxID=49181 RepID=UPI0035B4437F